MKKKKQGDDTHLSFIFHLFEIRSKITTGKEVRGELLVREADVGSVGKLASLSAVKGDKVPLWHLKEVLEGR